MYIPKPRPTMKTPNCKKGVKENLTGLNFGNLKVISSAESINGNSMWNCECQCENKTIVIKRSCWLKRHTDKIKSCGCIKNLPMPNFIDRTGETIGRLTIIKRVEDRITVHGRLIQWLCTCSCTGKEVIIHFNHMPNGKITQSCGCLRIENTRIEEGLAAKNFCLLMSKNAAERRSLAWNLTFEEFISLSESNCVYCGQSPNKYADCCGKTNGGWLHLGLDRKDSFLPYDFDNINPSCDKCNRLKYTLNVDDFLKHVKRIYLHNLGYIDTSKTNYKTKNINKIIGLDGYLNGENKLFRGLKNKAKSKNIVFNINYEECIDLIKSNCSYCGSAPIRAQILNKEGDIFYYGGIDRIDSSKGYECWINEDGNKISNNCSACALCNFGKMNYTLHEYYAHINKIVKHLGLNDTGDWSI